MPLLVAKQGSCSRLCCADLADFGGGGTPTDRVAFYVWCQRRRRKKLYNGQRRIGLLPKWLSPKLTSALRVFELLRIRLKITSSGALTGDSESRKSVTTML